MPVTSVTKDPVALTMTVVADFPVPVQRLWDVYVDPRQLERSGVRRFIRRSSPGMTPLPAVGRPMP